MRRYAMPAILMLAVSVLSGYFIILNAAESDSHIRYEDHEIDALFSRIYNCLEPDGYFISLHDGMTHERTQPALILEWLGGLLGSGQDVRFEQGEVADTMIRCGFRTVRSRTMETPIGLMELDIARK